MDDIEKKLMGMCTKDAMLTCVRAKYKMRITRDDHQNYAITDDFVTDRINLEIDNGRVTKVSWG